MRLTSRGNGCFFAKFLWTAGRNDSNHTPLEIYRRDATFSCRTLSLIPYVLRAVSILPKSGYSVFRDTQIDVGTSSVAVRFSVGWKTALHWTGKRTAWFLLFKRNFFQGRESRVDFTSGVNEPQHYEEVNRTTFFFASVTILHLRGEQHHTADRTASEWKPHYIGRACDVVHPVSAKKLLWKWKK